jgi:23S rRNA (uracil1939-C5)-methyltransferase
VAVERDGSRRRPPSSPERVRIDSIAAGGEGVGRLEDGRAVFVHRTAPGDLAEIEIVQRGKRWARARLLTVVEASDDRREPLCPHYAECGGCTLEHLTYEAQLRAKGRIVGDSLRRIGRMAVEDPEVVPSPRETRYRNRVSFALRREGTGRVVAGFHALGDPDRIVEIDGRCLLPEEAVSKAWDGLRASWGPDARRLPSGERLRLTLRGSAAGAVALLVEGGYSPGRPQELLDAIPSLESIWHRPGRTPAQLVAGTAGIPEIWGEEALEIGGAAFLQVNRRGAALLEEHVVTSVGQPAGLRIVDAYCGVGFHALRLARLGATVVGIELDPLAVAEARRSSPVGASFLEGPVEEHLPAALPADLVVLNPPRAGVGPEVADAISARPPSRVIYVSCDPATLARDLGRLGGAFEIESVRCFDLFPQTAHVETVVALRSLPGRAG